MKEKDLIKEARKMKKKLEDMRNGKEPKKPSSWEMFKRLWAKTEPDCRGALMSELISAWVLKDPSLENRYHNEIAFESRLNSHWK